MKKILIAVPCMDMNPVGFTKSIATLDKPGSCYLSFMVGSLIYTSRNGLAAQAIEIGADYVMWFDSDMVFDQDTLTKLLKFLEDTGESIVTGVYYNRTPPYRPVLFKHLELELDEDDVVKACQNKRFEGPLPEEPFEVAGCGFGCVLMRTEVLKNIDCDQAWFAPIGNIGEDCSFCLRAKEVGYKIWCDPSVKLGHTGYQLITERTYRAYQNFGISTSQD